MKNLSLNVSLFLIFIFGVSQNLHAFTPGSVYKISTSHNGGRVLTVENSSIDNAAKVFLWTETGANSQRWRAVEATNGYVYLENVFSGKKLHTQSAIQIVQNELASTNAFQWKIEQSSTNTDLYYIHNAQQSGCLELINGADIDSDGAPIRFFTKDSNENERQLWRIEKVDEVPNKITPQMLTHMMQSWKNRYFDWLKTSTGFWGEAECLEIILDAFETTGREEYKVMFEEAYANFVSGNGGWGSHNGKNWMWNEFNDDVAWAVLASIRAYFLFGQHPDPGIQYLSIAKTNFDNMYQRAIHKVDNLYYVLRWKEGQAGTTSCVNGPSEIAACYLGIATGDDLYFQKAKMLYESQRIHMYEPSTGRVYDSFDNNWASAYNQGTYLGAALMLYNRYGDEIYKKDAEKIMEFSMQHLTNSEGIITSVDSESGDYVSFKAILLRYVRRYVTDLGKLDAGRWLQQNAVKAYNNRNSRGISRVEWRTKTGEADNWNSMGAFAAVAVAMNAPMDIETIYKNAFNKIEAGSFDYISKMQAINHLVGEQMELTAIEDGAYVGYNLVDCGSYQATGIQLEYANDNKARTVGIRVGSPKGALISTFQIPASNGEWRTINADFSSAQSGVNNLYITFEGEKNGLKLKSFKLQRGALNYSNLIENDITDDGGVLNSQYLGFSHNHLENLIDNELATYYQIKNQSTGWIEYKAANRYKLTAYSISSSELSSNFDPKSWTLSASVDGENWKTLDQVYNQVFDVRKATLNFPVDVDEAYQYFKLNIDENNGGSDIAIAEWQLIGEQYFDRYSQDFIESGILESDQLNNAELKNLCDNDPISFVTFNFKDDNPIEIFFTSPVPIQLQGYALTSADETNADPLRWRLSGSKDGISWLPIDSKVNQYFDSRFLKKEFVRNSSTPYSYFKLEIQAVNNEASTQVKLAEWELYGYYLHAFDVTVNPNGQITAQWEGNYKPNDNVDERYSKLIDKNKSGKYLASNRKSFWSTYQSARPVELYAYSLTSANDAPNRDPKNWTLYGSNNNSTWTVLDKQENQFFPYRHSTLYYTFQTDKKYKFIRLTVEDNYGEKGIQLAEWQLFGRFNTYTESLMGASGVLTSSHSPGDNTSLSDLVDKDEVTACYVDVTSTTFGDGVWFTYELDAPATLTSYALTSSHNNSNNDPKDWKLQASNDAESWMNLDNQSNINFASRGERKAYEISTETAYKYYRLFVTARQSATLRGFQLAEWELFGTVASSVDIPFTSTLSIYPNPVSDYVYIESSKDAIISVLTIEGAVVYSTKSLQNTTLKINMNTYPEGVYIIQVKSNDLIESYKVLRK